MPCDFTGSARAMPALRRRDLAALMLVPPLAFWPAAHAADQAPAAVPAVRGQMAAWLQDTGLAASLDIEKLRWRQRDGGASAGYLLLELRFVTQATDPLDEAMRFGDVLQTFRRDHDTPLADALFFKLAHAASLPPRNVAVTVSVLEDSYAVLRDPTTQALRFAPAGDRNTRVPAILLPAGGGAALAARMTAPIATTAIDAGLPAKVQRFLVAYFTRFNAAAGRSAPVLAAKPLEQDFVGLDVASLRKLVITSRDYWERLQVSLELRQDAQGARAVCYLDGDYASGIGSRLPDEGDYLSMEKLYRDKLQAFGGTLMAALQQHLAGNAP